MAHRSNWRDRSNLKDDQDRDFARITFYYSSRQKTKTLTNNQQVKQTGIIASTGNSRIFQEIYQEKKPIKKLEGNYSLLPDATSTYQVFKSYRKRLSHQIKTFKLTHPNYGVTELIKVQLSSEDNVQQADRVGFVLSKAAFVRCLRDAYETGSSEQPSSFEEFMAGMKYDVHGMFALNKEHIEEVTVAQADLPKMGVVTAIVAFEDFISELMERMFDNTYGTIRTVEDFVDFQNRKSNRTEGDVMGNRHLSRDRPNLSHFWLKSCKEITEEMRRKYESLLKKNEPQAANANSEDEKCEQTNEHLKINQKELASTIATILSDFKKHCLEPLSAGITVDSVAQVVGRMLDQNFENSDQSSEIFKSVLNNMIQNIEADKGVIMQVNYKQLKEPFYFGLENENILQTIASPDNDDNDMFVEFPVNNRSKVQRYQLRKEDKIQIRNEFREFDGWPMWINEHTRYVVKVADRETLNHIVVLFSGIQKLFSQGRSANDGGIFGNVANMPSQLNLIAIKDTICPDGDRNNVYYNRLPLTEEAHDVENECEKHLLSIWKRALEEGDRLAIDYYLYYSIVKFFQYVALSIGQAASCCTWNLAKREPCARFGMNPRDVDNIFTDFCS